MHLAGHYDTLSRWGRPLDKADRRRVEQTLALVPAEVCTVLDLGCGDGTVSNALVARGVAVTGVDISREALRFFSGKGVVASLDHLPLPARSFDLVICAEVLEHLSPGVYERALAEIERVAKRWVIVSTPNREYLPAGLAACAACGHRYHVDQHVRAMGLREHRSLFRRCQWVRTVKVGVWAHFPPLVALEHRLLRIYRAKEGVFCPACGQPASVSHGHPFVERYVLRGLRWSTRLLPGMVKARWLVSLYRCVDDRTC